MSGKTVAIALCAYVAGVATMLAFDAFRAQPVVAPTPVVDAPATESSRPRPPRPPREHVSPDVAEPSPESSPKADRDARGTVLRGRLVHSDGDTDFGEYTLHVTLAAEDPLDTSLPLGEGADPDAEGRFEIPVAKAVVGAGYTVELEVYLSGTHTVVARLDRSAPALGAELDLGDIPIGSHAAVLVAGRAVDADGAPAVGARLTVMFTKGRNSRLSNEYDVTVGADGAFSIRGSSDGAHDLTVLGTDGWSTRFDVPFEPGTLDLVVVVQEVARVTGRVSLPSELPLDGFEVVVRGEHAAARSLGSDHGSTRGPTGFSVPAREHFTIQGAPAGTYRLGLRRVGSTALLAETPDFVVRPPTTAAPVLVFAVGVRRMEVVVRGPDGVPIPGAAVSWRDAAGAGAFSRTECDAGGLASWSFDSAALEILAHAAGYRVTRLETAEDALEIELRQEEAVRVQVRLPPGLADVPDGVEASVRLVWFGPGGPSELTRFPSVANDPYAAADVDVALDADAAHLDALVGQPGLYGLQLRARKPNSTSSTIGSFRLVVPAGADVVPAVLPFTRTEVDEFLREFAEE